MSLAHHKVKSVSKIIVPRGTGLQNTIENVLKTCHDLVGATLGPGGMTVVIERQETGLAPVVTKDGVTVFNAIGFTDPVHQVIMETAREASVRTAAEAGDGPQPMWANVLTPQGFVPMSKITPGMTICGTGGTTQTVIDVFEKGELEILEVSFEGGQTVECSEYHLWTVINNRTGEKSTINTKTLEERGFKRLKSGYTSHLYAVQQECVDFGNRSDLPIDSYTFGVLLGDGSLKDSGSIEISLGKAKEHIIEKLKFPENVGVNVTYDKQKHYFRIKTNGNGELNPIRTALESVGLRNAGSFDKFIPQQYLLSSFRDREALLRGLIDTDGHINSRGRFEFSSVSKRLAEDVVFLARSLGKTAVIYTYERSKESGAYSDSTIYRVTELKGAKHGNIVTDIKRTGVMTPMRCIKVSNQDSLYITDGFVPTHNTTSSSILSYSFVKNLNTFTNKHPHLSPQRVVRTLDAIVAKTLQPALKNMALDCDLGSPEGRERLFNVARISANGDSDLAKAVMDAYDIVGEEGNITITEASGPNTYEVNKIEGFPIAMGYEESCGVFYPEFINDAATGQCILKKPSWILYHGILNDYNEIFKQAVDIANTASTGKLSPNVVVVATGFSESFKAQCAQGFKVPGALSIFPLLAPRTFHATSQLDFLEDLSALTGAVVWNPLTNPIDGYEDVSQFGGATEKPMTFECGRFRSSVIGFADELLLVDRVENVNHQIENATSELDRQILRERKAKLTSGIARLVVRGASSADIKERRDRAEDAVCGVRSAIKYGALVGGGLTWLRLINNCKVDGELPGLVWDEVVVPSLRVPVEKLFLNAGYTQDELKSIIGEMVEKDTPYDLTYNKFDFASRKVLLDSFGAVHDALVNAVAVAKLLGTSGGIIAFPRNSDLEKREAIEATEYMKAVNHEANSRA